MSDFTYTSLEYVTEFQGQYRQLNLEQHHLDAAIREWRVNNPDSLIDVGAIPDECTEFLVNRCDMWVDQLNRSVDAGEITQDELVTFAMLGVKKQALQIAIKACLPLVMHKDHEDYRRRQVKLLVTDGRFYMMGTTSEASLVCQIPVEKISLLHDVEITLSETDCFLLQTWVQKRAPRDAETQLLITNGSLLVRPWWGVSNPRKFLASDVALPEGGFDLIQLVFNASPIVERIPVMVAPRPIKHLEGLTVFADSAVEGAGIPFTAMNGVVFGVCAPAYGDSQSRMDEITQSKKQFFDIDFLQEMSNEDT